jgi:hypothetical protein
MQVVRPISLTKKLVGVNMSSTLSEFGNASKVKKNVFEMDLYYDVQRPERNNKVSKAVTFVIEPCA